MPTFDDQTQPLNSLLRGEMSAVETYRQAVGKMGDDPEVDTLRCLESEHEKVTQMLRQHLVDRGAMPASNSGAVAPPMCSSIGSPGFGIIAAR